MVSSLIKIVLRIKRVYMFVQFLSESERMCGLYFLDERAIL